MSESTSELPKKRHPQWAGGPLNYGDPDDLRLRKTEQDVIIPKLLTEEATKRCSETLKVFADCAKREGLLVVLKCQQENDLNNQCLAKWLRDPVFVKEVTDKYLEARSHFRRTGEPLQKYERKKTRGFC